MKLLSLEPFITELVTTFGAADSLIGVSHACVLPAGSHAVRVTDESRRSRRGANPATLSLEECFNRFQLDLKQLRELRPDLILTTLPFERAGKEIEQALSTALSGAIAHPVQVRSVSPLTFEQVLESYERVALLLGNKQRGTDLSHRCKAQVMDWADNFYDRMKNKRVSFITSIDPLTLGGRWLSDMIRLCSAVSQCQSVDLDDPRAEWWDILSFRPDVIVVSPRGADMKSALGAFKVLEKFPDWEQIPAVKRGEVVFTEGQHHFHNPGSGLIDSMGILVSAVAGLESGYITPRDSFFRLRWLEMQRHRY